MWPKATLLGLNLYATKASVFEKLFSELQFKAVMN